VLVGTYTSVFIAAPILIYLGVGIGRQEIDEPSPAKFIAEDAAPAAAKSAAAKSAAAKPAGKPAATKSGKPAAAKPTATKR
jgi:preprotein translocase subunit SecF